MSDALRREYSGEGLTESDLAATPWEQARLWVDDAVYRSVERDDVPEPLAMSLATVDAAGRPDVRAVLMRFFDPAGPGFVTNLESAKGIQIAGSPAVAAALVWAAMFRAIRFRGTARELGRGEVERYFGERPWGSRDQRVGIAAVAGDRGPVRSGGGLRAVCRPVAGRGRPHRRARPRLLGRLPDHLRRGGVLGRPEQPSS